MPVSDSDSDIDDLLNYNAHRESLDDDDEKPTASQESVESWLKSSQESAARDNLISPGAEKVEKGDMEF